MNEMTLTEFLLARIAEDEAATYALDDYVQEGAWGVTRVLAECEAKRQIVGRCSAVGYGAPSHYLAQGVLLLLASVYAEHPDYREEWKP